MRLLFAIIFLLPFHFIAVAQSDFIINKKSDTLRGEIRVQSYDLIDRIQVVADGKKESYKATDIIHISINGETYKPQKLDNSIRIMKLMKEGFLSIYAYRIENQSSYDGRVIIKKDGKSIPVPNLSFKKGMSEFLEDCKTVSDQIKEGVYSRNELEKIVDDYNNCMVSGKSDITPVKPQQETHSYLQQEKTTALNNFTKMIASIDFLSRADALEILQDMQSKVDRNENIPNYEIEGLKSLLSSQESVQSELEKLITLLKEKSK